ncbi:MAG: ABC transporter substrate-binding protein [Gammaproteobacteria bacterium]|nr:ABC transporter substrate-binding protein [Gammaproteobacteria bacterium]
MRREIHNAIIRTSVIPNYVRNCLSVFCCVLLIAVSPQLAAKDNAVVRIAMSTTPLSSPFIIAHEKGYFNELGLNVEIRQVKGGNLALKAVLAGEADIATSSEAVVMFNSFKRNDFSIFCTFVTSDNDVKILAHRDSGINQISDLKGKKVGTILGTSAHFFLNHTLLMNGVSEHDVQISKLKPQESKKVLEEKQLDAIVTWEPYAYLAQKQLGDKVRLVEHDRVYVETFNAITTRDYANKNENILVKITQALMKAVQFIKDKPETTQKIVARVLGKELHVIRNTWSDFSFSIGLNQWLLTSMETEARWAINHGFLKAKKIPNYMNFINRKPLNISAPDKITIY